MFDVECGAGLVPFVCMFEYALHISVQYKKQHHGLPQDFMEPFVDVCGCVFVFVSTRIVQPTLWAPVDSPK